MTMTTVHDGHVWIEVIRPNGERSEVMLPDDDGGEFTTLALDGPQGP